MLFLFVSNLRLVHLMQPSVSVVFLPYCQQILPSLLWWTGFSAQSQFLKVFHKQIPSSMSQSQVSMRITRMKLKTMDFHIKYLIIERGFCYSYNSAYLIHYEIIMCPKKFVCRAPPSGEKKYPLCSNDFKALYVCVVFVKHFIFGHQT